MTLTRELRTSIAFMLAIGMALTVFVWGNQRLVQAQEAQFSMAEQINCYVEQGAQGAFNPSADYCQGTPPGESPDPSLAEQIICWVDYKLEVENPDLPFDPQLDYCDMPEPPAAQCEDGVDNDGDGLVDFPADPGCTGASDDTEAPNPNNTGPACSDGIDNDNDGKVDMEDPGCSSPSDTDETDQGGGGGDEPQCSDGIDNDSDGQTDFPADTGCANADDDNETNDGQGGGGGSPQCSDGIDNDGDGKVDMEDPACDLPSQDDESDDPSSSGGGGSNRHGGGSRSSNNNDDGVILGAETECPMYLTGYIRYGAQNDAGEVAKLQVFLNNFEGASLPVTGTYGPQTLAAVNAFQNKYAADVLSPWGARGATGYVYYTTQKHINTIYCKFEKQFPLTAAQIDEIAYVRQVQPTLRAQGAASMTPASTGSAAAAAQSPAAPAIGSVVLPSAVSDQNAKPLATSSTAAAGNASSTQGWFTKFINWLFGR